MSVPPEDAFEYCPRCGAHRTHQPDGPFRCEECCFVWYFTPPAAVGALISDPNGQLLLLVRGKDPGKGMLGVPGGFVDPGESLEEALIREVLEETSLTVTRHSYLTSAPNIYEYKGIRLQVIDAYYDCEVESFDCLKPQESEVSDWRFVTPDQDMLEQMAFPSARHAILEYLHRQ